MWTSRHRTWDEYLDIPFLWTRLLVTCFGALFLLILLVSLAMWLHSVWPKPPPRVVVQDENEEAEVVHVHGYMIEPRTPPLAEYALFLSLSALPILGMALVWRRPRVGFLMAGAGLALVVAALRVRVLLEAGLEDLRGTFGWPHDMIVLSLLAWLAFAWWKVGPARPHEPFQGPLSGLE